MHITSYASKIKCQERPYKGFTGNCPARCSFLSSCCIIFSRTVTLSPRDSPTSLLSIKPVMYFC